jgi:hypothetical protein
LSIAGSPAKIEISLQWRASWFDKLTMIFVILSPSKDAEGEEKFVYFVMR